MEIRLEEMELQDTSTAKDITKHEIEASAKILKIQNLTQDKNENLYGLLFRHFAPVMNTSPQKLALEFDYIYRHNTAYTRKKKLPPDIYVKFTRRLTRDTILKEVQDKEDS